MRTRYVAVCLLVAVGIQSHLASAAARDRKFASEVRVEQARGNLPARTKTIDAGSKPPKAVPEGGANSDAAKNSPTAPATCNQQNASSPACYSATQQARPPTR